MNPDLRKRTFNNINEFGISVIGVFDEIPFTYSIGAKKINKPDIFLPFLDAQSGTYFINKVFELIKKEIVTDSCIIDGLANNNLSLALIKTDIVFNAFIKNKYTIQAGQYYETEDYDLYQIVIPDINNKFPWESDYREFVSSSNGQTLYFYKEKVKNIKKIKV